MSRYRPVLALALLACCAHASPMHSQHYQRFIVCTGGGAQVVVGPGFSQAAYAQFGQLVGTSDCVPTRMAIFDWVCVHHPAFKFYFAEIPGPPALQGKSARLTTATGMDVLLDCQDQPNAPPPPVAPTPPERNPEPRSPTRVPQFSSGPAIHGICPMGQPACGNWCCGSDERCCNAGPGATCVSTQSRASDDGGFALPMDPCGGAVE